MLLPSAQENLDSSANMICLPTNQGAAVGAAGKLHRRFGGFDFTEKHRVRTPNQLLDVVLPNASQNAFRLVAYIVSQSGSPCARPTAGQEESLIPLSFRELKECARISQSSIRRAIEESIQAKYIRAETGNPRSRGTSGKRTFLCIRWDFTGSYISDPLQFEGFYAGHGNYSFLPDGFFTLAAEEPSSITKVVGYVLRCTLGWQDQNGGRRQEATISVDKFQKSAGIQDRKTAVQAIQIALEKGYIVLKRQHRYDPKFGYCSEARTFGVNLATRSQPRIELLQFENSEAGFHAPSQRYQNPTNIGSKTPPRTVRKPHQERFENPTDIKGEEKNTENTKEHQDVAVENAYSLLRKEGFSEYHARDLSTRFEPDRIVQQIAWLPHRNPCSSRLGLLRRAIEENYDAPPTVSTSGSDKNWFVSDGERFSINVYAELAGNAGEPLAQASAQDIAAAERFVTRLVSEFPTLTDPSKLGRKFAAFVRSRVSSNQKLSFLVSFAIRVHGDAFYVYMRKRQERKAAAMNATVNTNQEPEPTQEYLECLRLIEAQFRKQRPNDYALFEEARKRTRVETAQFSNEFIRNESLRYHDSEVSRLLAFQERFSGEVMSTSMWEKRRSSPGTHRDYSAPRNGA